MIFWTQMGLAFLAGVVFNKLWTGFLSAGYSMILLKATQKACLEMMKQSMDSTETAMEMKYVFLEAADSGEKKVEFEKRFDKQILSGLKNNMVKSLINSIPKGYDIIVKYKNWEEAMKSLEDSK